MATNFKKKKIVFDDTDIRHAQLKIRLQHDSLSQAQFFRALISGYLSKDKFIMSYIDKFKKENNVQSKAKRKVAQDDYEKSEHLMAKFGFGDDELENIFDMIAEEYPDL